MTTPDLSPSTANTTDATHANDPNPSPPAIQNEHVQQQQQPKEIKSFFLSITWRVVFILIVFNLFVVKPDRQRKTDNIAKRESILNSEQVAPPPPPPRPVSDAPYRNAWHEGSRMTLSVFVSPTAEFDFTTSNDTSKLIWTEANLRYNFAPSNFRSRNITISPIPSSLAANQSLWVHAFLTLHGYSPNRAADSFDPDAVVYVKRQVVEWRAPIRTKSQRSLLFRSESNDTAPTPTPTPTDPTKWQMFWKPIVRLDIVVDHTVFAPNTLPHQIEKHLDIDTNNRYKPVLYFNDFWLLEEHLVQVNESVKSLNLECSFNPQSLFVWQMFAQMTETFESHSQLGGHSTSEFDEMKRMLLETNPYLLGLTFSVSLLHTIFDVLAFKNDIQFWRNRKSMEGLSVRSLVTQFVCGTIIFLYLLDNDTSYLILLSTGVGLLIDLWKIQKALVINVRFVHFIPIPKITAKVQYAASATNRYDAEAMSYLKWLMIPLVIGYSVYSLVYGYHRSWYSWLLSSLVGAVYAFGFMLMTPQIWINYRLKSVENMNWRVLVYRSLNTFIDDLFAFIIKMPTLHRLSCFRDDIIFVIYLYQRWKYPIDPSRRATRHSEINENDTETEVIPSEQSPKTETEPNETVASASLDEASPTIPENTGASDSTTSVTIPRQRKLNKQI